VPLWTFLKIAFLTLAIWFAATLTYVLVANATKRFREGALPSAEGTGFIVGENCRGGSRTV
jgi:hypothetical protein